MVWWKAQVLELDEVRDEDVLAVASLEYVPYKGYLSTEEKAEFLPSRVVTI